MIPHVSIENFKTIKELQFDCKRVNLFIGDANTGKSNLFEAFSLLNFHRDLSKFIRFHEISHLFHEYDTRKEIIVRAGDLVSRCFFKADEFIISNSVDYESPFEAHYNIRGKLNNNFSSSYKTSKIRPYKYNPTITFDKSNSLYLEPPFGENLPSVLLANKELEYMVKDLLEDLGFKLLIKPYESSFEIIRETNGSFLSFPLITLSDTVKRIIFYLAILRSNNDSSILLEEPESNTFPFYTKVLAELIARHDENQFFVITHNSYLLNSIIEKTPKNDLAINLVYTDNYETKIRSLDNSGIENVLDLGSDVFLNFDKLLEAQ